MCTSHFMHPTALYAHNLSNYHNFFDCSHQATEQMLGYMEIDPLKDATVWEDLRDNRDLYVMINWDPSSRCVVKPLFPWSLLHI